MLVLQNTPLEVLKLPGLEWSLLEGEEASARFDLTLVMMETDKGCEGQPSIVLIYSTVRPSSDCWALQRY